ncbi:MAG: repeat protein precursor, partial [Sphingomonas bacterium]|nr:repeat protein precursor [Sphingomonas bacterium]
MGAIILKRALQAAMAIAAAAGLFGSANLLASSAEKPVKRTWVTAPPAPQNQGWPEVEQKNGGCLSCHTKTDAGTMHRSPAVALGCVDCHGGNSAARN